MNSPMHKISFAETSVGYPQGGARRVPCARRVFVCHCAISLQTTSCLASAIATAAVRTVIFLCVFL